MTQESGATRMPDPALALARFGLGARPGDLAATRDPRAALLADLAAGVGLPAGTDLADTPAALAALRAENEAIRLARAAPPEAGMAGPPSPPPARAAPGTPNLPQRLHRADAAAHLALALAAPVGFAERLVWFWSNHFAVSAAKSGGLRAIAGAFEREAIRPHALGRFADLVRAATTHPAMLLFLDNQGSIGPGSRAGARRGRGLNENLGREVLELHTLGVDGGYSQVDVGALAAILTGWTVAGPEGRLGPPGTAVFNPNAHEPGPQTLLGRAYAEAGPDQLGAALSDLARHPATARHVARKLARHFVADPPPPPLVERLERRFRETEGDLAAVSRALVEAPDAFSGTGRLRLPREFLVAAMRALGLGVDGPLFLGRLGALGQPLWTPQGPDGHPDTDAGWMSAEGLKRRLDLSARLAAGAGRVEPVVLLDEVLGAHASPETRAAVLRAESRQQAAALVLMSPEFQRR